MKFLLLVSLYLLGSARGAPSQLEEPPGSLNHPDAIQQFSGEPFSLTTPSDSKALFETSSGRDAFSKQAAFEHALVGRASGELISGVQAPAEQTSGEPAPAEQAALVQAAGDQGAAGQAATGQPSGEQASGEQASGEQPSGSPESTSEGPGVKCHTCSYMSSEGKCLRGEGTCTIQSSQQCMLKKIFEGGNLEFMVQGCENMCPSMSLYSHGTRMQLICCRDKSFCNMT
ncbi:acrosomal protein SP-10 [Pipistrellus kuhlii]|uniref:acrosomal protein SP-10 n=1 Tax=Pipistrellus kuhlii TaxID=59472 RepID=UPI00174F7532|nr:acrosomal protein SP-10 [Pipistrellus kuhlii]